MVAIVEAVAGVLGGDRECTLEPVAPLIQ